MKDKRGQNQATLSRRDHYYAVPVDEKRAAFAVSTSPIMSPEGTPSTSISSHEKSSTLSPKTFQRRLQKADEEEREEQVLRISTVAFSSDLNGNRSRQGTRYFSKEKLESNEISPLNALEHPVAKTRRQRPKGIRRLLAGFFASSFWRKRAKHFIPILLLIIYSATGGGIFWALEGRGREAAAMREQAKRALAAEIDRNNTIDMLINLTRAWHAEHVSERLDTYDYSRLDQLVYNASILPEYFPAFNADYPLSVFNASELRNVTAVSDMDAFVSLISNALNDSFVLGQDAYDLLDTLLYNFSRTIPPPMDQNEATDWSYWTSIFYAGTIYTTVGYGYITAITDLGRAMSMAYALFGIPLVLYTLNQLGRILIAAIWKCYCGAWRLSNWCLPVRYRMRRTRKVVAEFPFVIAVVLTVIWMMLCSALFCYLENWPFFTSLYFFFQSLTTIGFGDVKPQHHEYLVGGFLLIFIGLSLVSMCWSLLQLKFDHLINLATQKITQRFVRTELEGGRMALDAPVIETEIERIAAGENAWLAAFLDENRRRVLMNEWRHRAKMCNKYVQTEIVYTDRGIQSVVANNDSFSQTPQYLYPEHQYRVSEVPYREIRLGSASGGSRVGANDEFRTMLHGLRHIIGECRDTLSNKELSSAGGSPSHTAEKTGTNAKKRPPNISRASTSTSITTFDM